ncbi:hypothetical protein F2Q70_00040256 [Brassica cretica]|uniref:Uncharacterized protein n=1 Tax=Brassica cretica TaxID=69181 RepID=A0A8S9K547_BRACR|nr:hypothetical protein F2Q70_00040256 [Brassica cretica]
MFSRCFVNVKKRKEAKPNGNSREYERTMIKGIYNSPSGARLSGGAEYVRMNAPRVGGIWAVWGGVFSTLDCAMV